MSNFGDILLLGLELSLERSAVSASVTGDGVVLETAVSRTCVLSMTAVSADAVSALAADLFVALSDWLSEETTL